MRAQSLASTVVTEFALHLVRAASFLAASARSFCLCKFFQYAKRGSIQSPCNKVHDYSRMPRGNTASLWIPVIAHRVESHLFGLTEERIELVIQQQLGQETTRLQVWNPVEDHPGRIIHGLAHRSFIQHDGCRIFIAASSTICRVWKISAEIVAIMPRS